jgi:hypothetical protein
MSNSRRTPDEWHAIGQFWTQMGFVACLLGSVFGVLYCFIFVTQPMIGQAKNDAVLFEILKTVLTSMISIIGTLMAVGHGSQATAAPTIPKPPLPVPQVPVKPLSANLPPDVP